LLLETARDSKAGSMRFGSRWALGGFSLINQFDADFSNAVLGFDREAVLYCQGISDTVARDYALQYARMIQNRAKGVEASLPRIPTGLFEPNRNLIRATLERMSEKYFQSKMKPRS
jgi:hypothetical protein